jgi:hypothetical protein
MTEAGKKAGEAADDAAETIIELVEHTPLWAIMLALAIGGAVVFFAMLAVSKPPTITPPAAE